MLIANLNWAFPRKYRDENGDCYSFLFQNRHRTVAKDLAILVVHSPDTATVTPESLEGKERHRIQGTFSLHLKTRENKLPVIHANKSEGPANSSLVILTNKDSGKNVVYNVDLGSLDDRTESIAFVNNFNVMLAEEGESHPIYRNKFVGVLKHGTRVIESELDDAGNVLSHRLLEITPEGVEEHNEKSL